MADIAVTILGDAAGLSAALAESSAELKAFQDTMGLGMAGGAAKAEGAEDDLEDHSRGFSGRIASIFEGAGNAMGSVGLPFSDSVKKMGSDIDDATQKGSGFAASMSSIGKVAGVAIAGAAIGIGVEALHMADAFDTAQASMDTAIKNSGGNLTLLKPKIDATYSSMANLGFNSTDVASSLGPLITATGSTTKALGLESLAANIARMRHIDLASASSLLVKVMAGSNRALTQMGLNLNIGSAKLSSLRTAEQAVTRTK